MYYIYIYTHIYLYIVGSGVNWTKSEVGHKERRWIEFMMDRIYILVIVEGFLKRHLGTAGNGRPSNMAQYKDSAAFR